MRIYQQQSLNSVFDSELGHIQNSVISWEPGISFCLSLLFLIYVPHWPCSKKGHFSTVTYTQPALHLDWPYNQHHQYNTRLVSFSRIQAQVPGLSFPGPFWVMGLSQNQSLLAGRHSDWPGWSPENGRNHCSHPKKRREDKEKWFLRKSRWFFQK